MKKSAPSLKHKTPPLAVGEIWLVKLPGALQVACVEIDQLTVHTMRFHGTGGDPVLVGWYQRGDVKFLERLR